MKVRKLDLSENYLGDVAAKDITAYFIDNHILESLNLGSNFMTREGFRRLKEIIHHNSRVNEIIVKGNKDIEEESIEICERRMRAQETFQRILYY